MKNYILLFISIVLLFTTSCNSVDTKELTIDICSCFEKYETTFVAAGSDQKIEIVKECIKVKVDAKANEMNTSGDKSKLADYVYKISKSTSKELDESCAVFQKHKPEIIKHLRIR